MKKIKSLFFSTSVSFLVLVFSTACSSQSNTDHLNFKIMGSIEGVDEGTFIVFSIVNNKIDSSIIKNKKIKYEGTVDKFDFINIAVIDKMGKTTPYTSPVPISANQKITVTGTQDAPSFWQFKGDESTKRFNTFRNLINKDENDFLSTLNKNVDASGQPKLSKTQLEYVLGLLQKLNTQVYGFIDNNPSTLSAVAALMYSLNITPGDAYPNNKKELNVRLAKAFNKDVATSQLALQLQQILADIPTELQMAPDFTQDDANGTPVSLSSFRGKYVLVDFWASWCGPCRRENPALVEAYKRFKDKNFEVLGVSLDKNKASWVQAIENDKLTWTQVSDLKGFENKAAQLYGVRAIPSNYLIDPEGKIIKMNLRGQRLIATLEQTLK